MDYPNYLIYVSQAEIETRFHKRSLRQKMLRRCEGIRLTEVNGELIAAVDIEVYQYLVRFLMDNADKPGS